jgi:predicted transcriptional regulator
MIYIVDDISPRIYGAGMPRDFLDEIEAERTAANPRFPDLVGEAAWRRKLARKLVAIREKKRLSQTLVAARMQTSQSVVSKLEAGGDVKVSTLQRYCAAIGTPVPLK